MGVIAASRPPQMSPSTISPSTVLRARLVDRGTVSALELSGEADLTTLTVLRQALEAALERHGARVVIDVTGLRFCDVHSAMLILSVSRATPTSVIGAQGSVRRVLETLDSLQRVPRYDAVIGQRILC